LVFFFLFRRLGRFVSAEESASTGFDGSSAAAVVDLGAASFNLHDDGIRLD
jgi:hypothetical protein